MSADLRISFPRLFVLSLGLTLAAHSSQAQLDDSAMNKNNDSIPSLYNKSDYDVLATNLDTEAARQFRKVIAPSSLENWNGRKKAIHEFIQLKTNYKRFHDLPLNLTEHVSKQYKGYLLKNVTFQTRPNTNTTANLFVPEGNGPFPAILVMMGHSTNGKFYENYQLLGQDLAKAGYVALLVDPWGAGERSTEHLNFEYHGAHLGGHLMDVGETLMGMQITDNLRGIDLLSSLPYVNKELIGATGASGGGNQTMWITAVDERIKAAIPVVSVGTFESYVMNANCICELLPDGLSFLEESEILGLVAPRKLCMFNALQDANKAFYPSEMFRSYRIANQIYRLNHAEKHLSYQLFNLPHGYAPEMRHQMIDWFNVNLANKPANSEGNRKNSPALKQTELQVFAQGQRPNSVTTTEQYCKETATQLLADDAWKKRSKVQAIAALKENLRLGESPQLQQVKSAVVDQKWIRYQVNGNGGQEITALVSNPGNSSKFKFIFMPDLGKGELSKLVKQHNDAGYGVLIADLTGLGEQASAEAQKSDGTALPKFHTVSRSHMWLGRSTMGEWISEMLLLTAMGKKELQAKEIELIGAKDMGVAAVLASLFSADIQGVSTYQAPASYVVNQVKKESFYTQAIHIPQIINWGDLSMAMALANADIQMFEAKDIVGNTLSTEQLAAVTQRVKDYQKALKTKNNVLIKN